MNSTPHPHSVDIIMPVFNASEYLKEALDSVLEQTFVHWRLLIIDDGSTDTSLNIIKSYALRDSRVHFKSRKNMGLVGTLNELVHWSTAPLIARMDADDISHVKRLEKQFRFLAENADVDMVGSWVELFGSKQEVWHYRANHLQIRTLSFFGRCSLLQASLMCKRKVFEQYPFDESYTYLEDFDFLSRIIVDNRMKMAAIREPLYRYRQHNNSIVYQYEKLRVVELKNAYLKFLKALELELSETEFELLYAFNFSKLSKESDIEQIGAVVKRVAHFLCQNTEDIDHEFAYRWLVFCLENLDESSAYHYFLKYFANENLVFLKCKKYYVERESEHASFGLYS